MVNEVYLDYNSTTPINEKARAALNDWAMISKNPSSDCKSARKCRAMIDESKRILMEHTSCSLNPSHKNYYYVIYTSGATESNCFILKECAMAYYRKLQIKPCIIVSAVEHDSILSCCEYMSNNNMADIVYIKPNCEGAIPSTAVENAIRSNSNIALISIMYANNEIGVINNVRDIGALAHSNNIPLHVDAVQMFGKYKIKLPDSNIDAMSASMHKLYGPVGVGLLFVRKELVDGYGLEAQIHGKQQAKLRGGTENVMGIASSIVALKHTFANRESKNDHLLNLRKYLIAELGKIYPIGDYPKYVIKSRRDEADMSNIDYDPASLGIGKRKVETSIDFEPVEIIIFGPPVNQPFRYIPNTVLLSVVKNVHDKYGVFCNVKLKRDLDKRGFVVSIGSACNTSNSERSHVLKAIECPDVVSRGVIRISFGDMTKKSEINEFINAFRECCEKQIVKDAKRQPAVKTKRK